MLWIVGNKQFPGVLLVTSFVGLLVTQGWAAEQTCDADGTCVASSSLSSCQDKHELCEFWSSVGECNINQKYMHSYCPKSCKVCDKYSAKLDASQMDVGLDLGVAQSTTLYSDVPSFSARILESRSYIEGVQLKPELLELCRNQHEHCTIWALAGECDANPTYMKRNCAPACFSCDYLSIETRCPMDPNARNAWEPGDLDAMFTRLTSEPFLSQYSVEILSSPSTTGGPWVITMENVVKEDEAERLIELGAIEGYTRSADVGKLKADGSFESNINNGRTSTNAWCQKDCYEDELARAVVDRLTEITGINETNSEYLQLLRYEVGQHYQTHHDYIAHHLERQQGVRILTLYLYLNDVDGGGGTNFDQLGITVMPKRGRALLWPSVFDADPNEKDGRTTHQALPVTQGIKYGANAWFHQRDFKTPNEVGCT